MLIIYPKFVQEEYVVLELSPRYQNGDWVIWNQEFPDGAPEEIRKLGEEFSHLKIGFRGDLRFYENPNIYEVAELFQEQTQTPQITMSKNKWKRTAYGQSFSAPKGERKRNEEKEMKKKK